MTGREKAMAWWDMLGTAVKVVYTTRNGFKGRLPDSLTDREIEEIWRKETNN